MRFSQFIHILNINYKFVGTVSLHVEQNKRIVEQNKVIFKQRTDILERIKQKSLFQNQLIPIRENQ